MVWGKKGREAKASLGRLLAQRLGKGSSTLDFGLAHLSSKSASRSPAKSTLDKFVNLSKLSHLSNEGNSTYLFQLFGTTSENA